MQAGNTKQGEMVGCVSGLVTVVGNWGSPPPENLCIERASALSAPHIAVSISLCLSGAKPCITPAVISSSF